MTAKEALEIRNNPTVWNVDDEQLSRCIDEALEKQIPKKTAYNKQPGKVKAFDGEKNILTYSCYPCPDCGKWITTKSNFCEYCGQALDWSEE